MSANSARLKRMHKEAKRLRERHPNMKWATAMKEAGKKERGGKVAGRKKKGHPKKMGAKYRVTHHVEKIGKVSIRDGRVAIGALTIPQARKAVESKLAWALLARESAKNKTARNKAAKDIKVLKTAQRKLDNI